MSDEDIRIRQAHAGDAAVIAELLRSLGWFGHMKEESPLATRLRVAEHLALCLSDDSHSIYVAELDGQTVGYVSVHWLPYLILAGPEGYVSEIFVREGERGQGIGSRLLTVVSREARQRGCVRLQLVNMRQRDSYQRGFYPKLGWQERPDAANFVYPLED